MENQIEERDQDVISEQMLPRTADYMNVTSQKDNPRLQYQQWDVDVTSNHRL